MKTIQLADEPFYTIQGEGPSAGRPALFIRLQGCTVGCSWCDTKYSWDPTKGKQWRLLALKERIESLPQDAIVVITGGEPVEYPDVVHAILDRCPRGRWVEMETSGYIHRPDLTLKLSQVIVSPKMIPSAGVLASKQANPTVVAQWLTEPMYGTVKLKFVVGCETDLVSVIDFLARVITVLDDQSAVLGGKVWLMPEGVRAEEIIQKGQWLAERCKELGFNLSLRQHVLLWGPRRGV